MTEIIDERAHYLRNVLRLRPGAEVDLFNSKDGEWRARMAGIERRTIRLEVFEQRRKPEEEEGPTPVLRAHSPQQARMDAREGCGAGRRTAEAVLTEYAVVELAAPTGCAGAWSRRRSNAGG